MFNTINRMIDRMTFEVGKRLIRSGILIQEPGVPVYAKRTPQKPVGFVTYRDHMGGGKYTALEQKNPWSIDVLEIEKLHKMGITGSGEGDEKIATIILDTGGSPDHEDLKGVYLEDLCRNFTGGNPKDWKDRQSHATHCAGIVAAQGNDVGVLGIAPGVKIVAGKVLDDHGSGTYEGIIEALDWVKDELRPELKQRGYKYIIVSMSLGGPTYDPLNQKVKQLVEAGIFVGSAAGNSGDNYPDDDTGCPGNASRICASDCVAAVDEKLIRTPWSSDGDPVTIAAPGARILSTVPGGYAVYSGTSMATPFSNGLIALLMHAGIKCKAGALTPKLIRDRIWPDTATDKGKPGRDTHYGFGVVNPTKAVEAVKGLRLTDTPVRIEI